MLGSPTAFTQSKSRTDFSPIHTGEPNTMANNSSPGRLILRALVGVVIGVISIGFGISFMVGEVTCGDDPMTKGMHVCIVEGEELTYDEMKSENRTQGLIGIGIGVLIAAGGVFSGVSGMRKMRNS